MANVLFKKGLRANLPQSYAAGTFYVTTDERAMYLDINDNTRIRLGDFQEFSSLEALKANVNPSTTAMYYVSDLNVLAKWNGVDYVQINPDTGATSFEVVGEGNAVTSVSYDATTRKLTLTKGETFATKSELDALSTLVGEIPTDYTEETIVAYINKKAEETLQAASGNSTETAASVKQQLDDYKALNDPKVQANTDAIATIKNGASVDSFADVETELAKKVDKEDGKSLVSDSEITKLAGVSEGANKVESSETNGYIKIDGVETVVYTHPDSHTVSEISDFDSSVKAYNYATKTEAEAYANAKDEAIQAAQDAADAAQDAVDAIEADYLKKADKDELSTAIADEKARAEGIEGGLRTDVDAIKGDYLKTADKTALQEQITANADAISLLANGVDTETIDGVNDLINYVNEHGTEVTGMKEDIAANAKAISDHETLASQTYETKTDASSKLTEAKNYADAKVLGVVGDPNGTSDLNTIYGIKKYAEEKASAAESSAKTYADGLDAAMNTRVEALEAIDHEHTNKDELDLITSGDVLKWNAAYSQAHAHSNYDVLQGITSAKVEAWDKAEGNAKTYADGLNTTMDARVAVLEGIDHDAYVVADATLKTELQGEIATALETAKTDASNKDAVVLAEAQKASSAVQTALDTYKTDNDAVVALKANSADVYAKTETYTQAEVDALIEAATQWGSF